MKNKIYLIAFLIIVAMVSSCKKDDNSPSSSSTSVLNNALQQGSWRITSYNDNGNDETNHYSGYQFQFNSNGTVSASKTGSTISGSWNSGNDDSTLKLVLSFSANPFDELNDDWHVTQQSSTIIKLQDVSGGNGGTDYLTFERV